MDSNLWWIYDGGTAVILLSFIFITAKRGLAKAVASFVGFILSIVVAVALCNTVADSIYHTIIRSSNVKNLTKHMNNTKFVEMLDERLEDIGYSISVNQNKLETIIKNSDDYDNDIIDYLNKINGKKLDEKARLEFLLHDCYADILKAMISEELSPFCAESASRQVIDDPKEFEQLIPLFFDAETQTPAAEYICEHYVDEPYIYCFKLVVFIAFLGLIMLITFLITKSVGKGETMETSFVSHAVSGILGMAKGAVFVIAIAVIIRISVVYGTNQLLFFENPAIEKTYVFKYIYEYITNYK
ncbi:MAG: CvpA family protein [Ruminococcus sp.]|nr:CvpA family protein [Ruminococcus sp.]